MPTLTSSKSPAGSVLKSKRLGEKGKEMKGSSAPNNQCSSKEGRVHIYKH
jgi:hypothetical protein